MKYNLSKKLDNAYFRIFLPSDGYQSSEWKKKYVFYLFLLLLLYEFWLILSVCKY